MAKKLRAKKVAKAATKKKRVPKTRDQFTKTDWINKFLWPIFSRYIRTRDCIATTGDPNFGKCITCGKTYPFKRLQAGHFIPGRTDAILFDERQVHAQCYRCNMKLQGMWHKYYLFMLDKGYTHEDIQVMIAESEYAVEFSRQWFEDSAIYYEEAILDMKNNI